MKLRTSGLYQRGGTTCRNLQAVLPILQRQMK